MQQIINMKDKNQKIHPTQVPAGLRRSRGRDTRCCAARPWRFRSRGDCVTVLESSSHVDIDQAPLFLAKRTF